MLDPSIRLNIKAHAVQFMMNAKPLANSIRLSEKTNRVSVTLPLGLFNFLEENDGVVVTISIVKATIEEPIEQPGLLLPN